MAKKVRKSVHNNGEGMGKGIVSCVFDSRCMWVSVRANSFFGDLAMFTLIFAFYILNVRHMNVRFACPTDLESTPHASTPTLIIATKFEVDVHTLPSYSVFVC